MAKPEMTPPGAAKQCFLSHGKQTSRSTAYEARIHFGNLQQRLYDAPIL